MSDKCQDTLRCNPQDLQQAMSIHTRKITDSCRDKDCIEDLRVYLTRGSQSLLDSCAGAKVRSAELLYTYILALAQPVGIRHQHRLAAVHLALQLRSRLNSIFKCVHVVTLMSV